MCVPTTTYLLVWSVKSQGSCWLGTDVVGIPGSAPPTDDGLLWYPCNKYLLVLYGRYCTYSYWHYKQVTRTYCWYGGMFCMALLRGHKKRGGDTAYVYY